VFLCRSLLAALSAGMPQYLCIAVFMEAIRFFIQVVLPQQQQNAGAPDSLMNPLANFIMPIPTG
jgi:hypothetical protein